MWVAENRGICQHLVKIQTWYPLITLYYSSLLKQMSGSLFEIVIPPAMVCASARPKTLTLSITFEPKVMGISKGRLDVYEIFKSYRQDKPFGLAEKVSMLCQKMTDGDLENLLVNLEGHQSFTNILFPISEPRRESEHAVSEDDGWRPGEFTGQSGGASEFHKHFVPYFRAPQRKWACCVRRWRTETWRIY